MREKKTKTQTGRIPEAAFPQTVVFAGPTHFQKSLIVSVCMLGRPEQRHASNEPDDLTWVI